MTEPRRCANRELVVCSDCLGEDEDCPACDGRGKVVACEAVLGPIACSSCEGQRCAVCCGSSEHGKETPWNPPPPSEASSTT